MRVSGPRHRHRNRGDRPGGRGYAPGPDPASGRKDPFSKSLENHSFSLGGNRLGFGTDRPLGRFHRAGKFHRSPDRAGDRQGIGLGNPKTGDRRLDLRGPGLVRDPNPLFDLPDPGRPSPGGLFCLLSLYSGGIGPDGPGTGASQAPGFGAGDPGTGRFLRQRGSALSGNI